MKEICIRGKSHLEGDKLNMNSDKEAILTSSGKLDGGKLTMGSEGCFDGNSGNLPAAITNEDNFFFCGCVKSELPEPNKFVKESKFHGQS